MEQPRVIDTRRVKDDSVGGPAKVSTSTLKPKNVEKVKKSAKATPKPAAAPQTEEAQGAPLAPRGDRRDRAKPAPALPARDLREEGLEELEDDHAWCSVCGRVLFVDPAIGVLCEAGHENPTPRLTFDEAAALHYRLGRTIQVAADMMAAHFKDVQEIFEEAEGEPVEEGGAPTPEEVSALDGDLLEQVRYHIQADDSDAEIARITKASPEVITYLRSAIRDVDNTNTFDALDEPEPEEPERTPISQIPIPANVQSAMGGHGMHHAAAFREEPAPERRPGRLDPSDDRWRFLQHEAPPLSDEEYARVGRLYVASLVAAGVDTADIADYARAEREVISLVRRDILGR